MAGTARKEAPNTRRSYMQFIAKDLPDAACMLEKWESLASRVVKSKKACALHRELKILRTELKEARDSLLSHEIVLDPPHVLDNRINCVAAELAALEDRKAAMLALNHRRIQLIADLGTSASLIFTALKDGVADLYGIWDETFQKGNEQLCALQAVQQFSVRLAELQSELLNDKDNLAILNVALEAGATTEVCSSVRHVARRLCKKHDITCQNGTLVKDVCQEEVIADVVTAKFGDASPISLTQEGGSVSDSGISDSGSEQELSERERKLAALRRLTHTLESQLAPGSQALAELRKRVEGVQNELKDLQKQCRELIVRTITSVEARAAKRAGSQIHHYADKRKKANGVGMTTSGTEGVEGVEKSGATDAGDPDKKPRRTGSRFWCVLLASLPFQLGLAVIFWAAFLAEPYCCEATNTLNLLFTPQLRYVRGPPPV